MSFLYPWFLLALSAISIPIVIHLFHFRRYRKVYFSSIRFLEQIQDETQKQARLKHLLVLFSRILALAFLVMAFARPYIATDRANVSGESNRVSIFIDNSFSMEAASAYGTLLDHAKQNARDIIESFGPTDRFMLLTNDFEGRHQRFVSREEFLLMLEELDFSPVARPLAHAVERQRELLHQEADPQGTWLFVLSDFQKNITDFSSLDPDSLIRHFFLPFAAQRPSNLFIDSVWIDNPVRMSGQTVTAMIRLFNDSEEAIEGQSLRLYVNGSQRTVASFDVQAGGYTDVPLTWTVGSHMQQQAYAEISDYPVLFDDRLYFSFRLSQEIPVLALSQGEANPFIHALLGRDTTFVLQRQDAASIDFSSFSSQNLIIVNELDAIGEGLALELKRFAEAGGNLLIFPSERASLNSYNSFLSSMGVSPFVSLDTAATRVSSFNDMHPVYTGVFEKVSENIDLPRVNSHYVISRSTTARDSQLMQLQNGNPFFISTAVGQGQVFLSAVPASDGFSNFPRHAMFVPTIYNIALHSAALHPLYYTVGKDEMISIREQVQGMEHLLRIAGQNMEIIPEARSQNNTTQLFLHGQISDAGQFNLMLGKDTLRYLSFNFDRQESLLQSYSGQEISDMLIHQPNAFIFEPGVVSLEKQIEMYRGGKQLWKLFLVIGLLFLVLEVVLLRVMR